MGARVAELPGNGIRGIFKVTPIGSVPRPVVPKTVIAELDIHKRAPGQFSLQAQALVGIEGDQRAITRKTLRRKPVSSVKKAFIGKIAAVGEKRKLAPGKRNRSAQAQLGYLRSAEQREGDRDG